MLKLKNLTQGFYLLHPKVQKRINHIITVKQKSKKEGKPNRENISFCFKSVKRAPILHFKYSIKTNVIK